MTSNVTNSVPYVRSSRQFPSDLKQLSIEVNRSYIDLAYAINNRTIGIFPSNESGATGESWYLSNNQRQQTLRRAYPFGAIAAGAELDIPTGITSFVTFTRIYGTVITNVVDYRPLPYIDPVTLTTGMAILVGTVGGIQQIRIILGATAPDVTSGIAVLEYLSNV